MEYGVNIRVTYLMLVLTFFETSVEVDFLVSDDVPGKDACEADRSGRSDKAPTLPPPPVSVAGAAIQ